MARGVARFGPHPERKPTLLHGPGRQAETRIHRLTTEYGISPASARNLHMATIQGTMLYAAVLTWKGQKGVEGEHYAAINCVR